MRYLLLLLAALPGAAQSISAGVRGGAPILEAFDVVESRFQNVPHRYTIGPTLEVRLPANLTITLDALYQKLEFEAEGVQRSGTQWEFPVMLRKNFGPGPAKPFLAGGLSFNRISGLAIREPTEFIKTSTAGVVFGAGVEVKVPLIRVTPEIRYTHRLEDQFRIGNLIKFSNHQLTALVGITF
jgi:hypothetical protein